MSDEFKTFNEVREIVLRMNQGAEVSKYWAEELAQFEYVLEGGPKIAQNLCKHFFSSHYSTYNYLQHHSFLTNRTQREFDKVHKNAPPNLFVPEPQILGNFGHFINVDGQKAMVNHRTIETYKHIIALRKKGWLGLNYVCDIGSGMGNAVGWIKTLNPNIKAILVDFPLMLLFAGTFLKTLFPSSKHVFMLDANYSKDFDFLYVPHYLFNQLTNKIDYVVNIASFQEMTNAQVESYVSHLQRLGCKYLYSFNRNINPNNPELTDLKSILSKYYKVEEVQKKVSFKERVKNLLRPKKQSSIQRQMKEVFATLRQ